MSAFPNTELRVVKHFRHYNARVHETWSVRVPEELLTNPTYFDDKGNSTPAFDEWVTDSGEIHNQETSELDDERAELDFESDVEPTLAEKAKTAIDEGRFLDAMEYLTSLKDI